MNFPDLQPKTTEQINEVVEKVKAKNQKSSRQEAKRILTKYLPNISVFLLQNNEDNINFQRQMLHLKAAFPSLDDSTLMKVMNEGECCFVVERHNKLKNSESENNWRSKFTYGNSSLWTKKSNKSTRVVRGMVVGEE